MRGCQGLGDYWKPLNKLPLSVTGQHPCGEETWRQRFPRRWCVGWDTRAGSEGGRTGQRRREESNVIARKASATLDRNSGAEGGHSDIILN